MLLWQEYTDDFLVFSAKPEYGACKPYIAGESR